jgi:hypothetical protein
VLVPTLCCLQHSFTEPLTYSLPTYGWLFTIFRVLNMPCRERAVRLRIQATRSNRKCAVTVCGCCVWSGTRLTTPTVLHQHRFTTVET